MNTRRKVLVAGISFPSLVWAGAAHAQAKPSVLIGVLNASSQQAQRHVVTALREGLSALGWKEGVNLVLQERWADGRYDRLQALAEELASRKPAIIVASPSQAVSAAARAAPAIPIVVAGGDPLAAGLVTSLARPGGMITGVSNIVTQINEKHLELLVDAVPKLRRVGILGDSNNPSHAALQDSARHVAAQRSVEAHFVDVTNAQEIEPAIKRLAKLGIQALVVAAGPLLLSDRQRIAELASSHRWPFVGGQSEYAEAGALLAYGVDRAALHRRAAYYVDRILKGAKPRDLPIEQPTVFDLVVNLKTAKQLGLTIPQSILVRATRVIE